MIQDVIKMNQTFCEEFCVKGRIIIIEHSNNSIKSQCYDFSHSYRVKIFRPHHFFLHFIKLQHYTKTLLYILLKNIFIVSLKFMWPLHEVNIGGCCCLQIQTVLFKCNNQHARADYSQIIMNDM